MKNGDIKVDNNGKKWVWRNSIFYEYDDRSKRRVNVGFTKIYKK